MNPRTIAAQQHFLVIAQHATFFSRADAAPPQFRPQTKLFEKICVEQLAAILIAEHPNERIVYFNELPVGRAEENALLNIVEKLAVTALGFAPVRDVLQHVYRAQVIFRQAAQSRRRNQISAFLSSLLVLFGSRARITAERADVLAFL